MRMLGKIKDDGHVMGLRTHAMAGRRCHHQEWNDWTMHSLPYIPTLRVFCLLTLLVMLPTACASESRTPPAPTSIPPTAAVTAGVTAPATPPATANAAAALAGLGDPLYPRLGNAGYDVQHYTIDLDVDVASNTISGTTTISAQATQDLTAFHLDFSGLQLHGVAVDGVPARFARVDDELVITPTTMLATGVPFTVTADYAGTPRPIRDPSVPTIPLGWLRQPDGLFVVSEPSGAMNWYPVNNHPADKATYTFRMTVPQPYQVAANGVLTDVSKTGETATYTWEMTDPMASYLATVHIGEYTVQEQTGPHDLPIRNYFPVDTPESVKAGFAVTPQMIAYMEELIGPYPFDTYGVALLNEDVGWALETQTLSTFGGQGGGEETIFHELAHQWFGDSVSPATWRDVWLNEGFATYFALLWANRHAEPGVLDAVMERWQRRIEAGGLGSPIPDSPADLFGPAVYQRGALALHTLRRQVGDEKFFKILRTYYQRHAGGNASTQDFIDVVEEAGGMILDFGF